MSASATRSTILRRRLKRVTTAVRLEGSTSIPMTTVITTTWITLTTTQMLSRVRFF
jgi:hypothetical protein